MSRQPEPAPGAQSQADPVQAATAEVSSGSTDSYDDAIDSDLPVPNADRLVAECVVLAGVRLGTDPQLCDLVAQYWRFVPDEELVGLSPAGMLDATVAHRDLAAQRVQGELRLRV